MLCVTCFVLYGFMENAYLIKGGRKLTGKIKLSGAKNVALKVIIAALLFDQPVILKNIPRINDVFELIKLVTALGGKVQFIDRNVIKVDGRELRNNKVGFLSASKIRVSFMLFAPLLLKFGECYIPNPGGCRIGARPIDRIIDGMKKLGVSVDYNHQTGYYFAKITKKIAGQYRFPKPTHTGTELLILLSVLGKEKVILENGALEPEIDDLINFLNQAGAQITREKQKIVIIGKPKLIQKKPYSIIADRNEAVTYSSLVIATKGELTIGPIAFPLIETFYSKLKAIGSRCQKLKNNWYRFSFSQKLKASRIETAPHPGFMTDWQPNWAVLMTQAAGQSTIIERVFENRFSYVEELRKIGAKIDFIKLNVANPADYFFFNYDPQKTYNQGIKIQGPQPLHGGVLNIADLRAGATLAIGALVASGESIVNGASILERGYEDFVKKVQSLGGEIKKI